MQFKAKYLDRKTGKTYWTTIAANDLREAELLANRKAIKGYIVELIMQAHF